MKNILIIGDSLEKLHPDKDTTIGMIQAAWRLGLAVDYAEADVSYQTQHPAGIWQQPLVQSLDMQAKTWKNFDDYDLVLLRYDPPVNEKYREVTQLVDTVALRQPQIKVSNHPASLLRFNEKLLIFQFPQWIAPTLVSRDQDLLLNFLADQEKIVLKPLDGLAGRGVFVLEKNDSNRFALLELLTNYGQRAIMAQRFLPGIVENGDKRILLVHGQVPPFGLIRRPKKGEHRANLAVGGSGEVAALTAREIAIAESLIPFCQQHGLDFVGLDVIDGHLTEVNITSPTGARQIAAATAYDPCLAYLDGFFKR
jgi:glutathione synthase